MEECVEVQWEAVRVQSVFPTRTSSFSLSARSHVVRRGRSRCAANFYSPPPLPPAAAAAYAGRTRDARARRSNGKLARTSVCGAMETAEAASRMLRRCKANVRARRQWNRNAANDGSAGSRWGGPAVARRCCRRYHHRHSLLRNERTHEFGARRDADKIQTSARQILTHTHTSHVCEGMRNRQKRRTRGRKK